MKPDRQTPDRRRSGDSGFTLVELLVASAITLVLAGIMIAILAQMTGTWARAGGGLMATQQGELALDTLARDLQAAVLRRDGRVWLAAAVQPDQSGAGDTGGTLGAWSPPVRKPGAAQPGTTGSSLALAPPSRRIEDCRFGMAGVWLRFIADIPGANDTVADASAPRAVAYQIVRRAVSAGAGAPQRYGLFRTEVRPFADIAPARDRSTFAVGFDLLAPAYNTAAGGGNLGDAGTIRRPRRDHLLANDVVDFGVRFFGRREGGGGAVALLFPQSDENRGFAGTSDTAAGPTAPGLPAAAMSYGFPEEAELFIRVLTEDGARRIEALEQGRATGADWWAVALAHSVVVTRYVRLEATP